MVKALEHIFRAVLSSTLAMARFLEVCQICKPI